ncbi:MAG TPA: CpaF family protein [Actinomycetota bacterium]|nr:CpaF family protein [Actinomycetota bacterium]
MKLSDKLAALEAAERTSMRREEEPAVPVVKGNGSRSTRAPEKEAKTHNKWSDAKRTVRDLVLAEIGPKLSGPKALKGSSLEKEVKACLDRILRREEVRISPIERQRFLAEVMSDTLGYGPLDAPLADESITEIMCNGHDEIFIERKGLLEKTDLAFADEEQYRQVIDKIVSAVGRRVDESSPMVDARLPNGSRVNAIIPPLALRGSVLTIRKFAEDPFTAKDLVNFGTFSLEFVHVLEAAVRGKLNVLISGGTGTGKTTLLNVLSSFIPERERILTIEDAAELQLQQPHVVSLEARPANAEGRGEVRIRDLVRNALRMRPDRIVVGEVRGAEALDMLQAMNTGHEGSLTTVHANSPRDALSRLETMVLMAGFELPVRAIREQIASAINVIVQLERQPDGSRKVTSVQEIQGMEGDVILLQEVFKFHSQFAHDRRQVGQLEATGLRPKFAEKLIHAGIELPAKMFQRQGRTAVERAVKISAPARPGMLSRGRRR